MNKNCFNCKSFDTDEYEKDTVYICKDGEEASENIQFPYNEDMQCFKEK